MNEYNRRVLESQKKKTTQVITFESTMRSMKYSKKKNSKEAKLKKILNNMKDLQKCSAERNFNAWKQREKAKKKEAKKNPHPIVELKQRRKIEFIAL